MYYQAIKVRYSEPILHQQNGSIIKGVPRDWSRGIHSVNKVPRPTSPCSTYQFTYLWLCIDLPKYIYICFQNSINMPCGNF
jgi:hypothetical protein